MKTNKNHSFRATVLTSIIATACTSGNAVAENKTSTVTPVAPPVEEEVKEIKQPNIIVIYTDDQRYGTLGAFDNQVIKTPNVDQFFENSVKFTNANVAFALSSPSRAAMITGRYGSANGVLQLGSGLNQGENSVSTYLKESGYQTAMSGKWHIKQRPEELDFDWSCYFLSNGTYYNRNVTDQGVKVKPTNHCDDYCVKRSIDFLQERDKDKPFFLLHCTQLPHMNNKLIWDAKDETKAKYNVEDMPCPGSHLDDLSDKPSYLANVRNRTQAKNYGYPDKDAIKSHTRDYYSVITEMDEFLNILFDEIEAQGLLENTYIFFMGDNGWMLGDHGFTSKVLPYRGSTNVPFMVMGPDVISTISSEMVSNIDIAPTVLEYAGIDVPKNMHGKSLVSTLRGEKNVHREYFVYEGLGDYGGTKPILGVISDDYRYIVTYTDANLNVVDFEELYNIKKDPDEMNNLASDSSLKDLKEVMNKEIERHKKEILNL